MLDRATCHRRQAEIPEVVRHIAIRNPIVQQLAHAYATGNIITLEECLAQMVVCLADRQDALDRHVVDLIGKCGIVYDHFS